MTFVFGIFQYTFYIFIFLFFYQALTNEEEISYKNKNNIEKIMLSYGI